MATSAQITQVRLNINDEDSEAFTDAQITAYVDEHDSVSYASWKLCEILLVRLRKAILKKDITGIESTEFGSIKERMELLKELIAMYKKDYYDEAGTGSGRFISSTKPDIAGGDV